MLRRIINIQPLLFLTGCLLGSAFASGEDGAAIDNTVQPQNEMIQLAMLKHSQNILKPGEAPVADPANGDGGQAVIVPDVTEDTVKPLTEEELAGLRTLFLQAERALAKGDDAGYSLLADKLEQYPLYPYLQYQWLKKHLGHERQVRDFLKEHETSRYAGILKRKWLYRLAKKKQWQTFLQYYSDTGDTSLSCYYRRAQFNTGEKQAALDGAKALWVVGHSQPKACDPLFRQLQKSDLFNAELFWQRFEAAMSNNKTSLAKYVKKFMSASDRETAALWLKLHSKPERHLPELLKHADTTQAPTMFVHAMKRLAGRDVYRAIELWDDNRDRFAVSRKQADKLEKRLAMQLAFDNDSDAYERLGDLDESDYSSKSWRIRVALYEQDWPRVITAIEDLDEADRNREKWRYWLARASSETGRPIQAEELFSGLAEERDFYGYLAAERLNQHYRLADDPVEVSAHEIAVIENREAFRVASEFLALGRDKEAKQQWWHAVRQLDKSEIPAAAKLAQQWQWNEIPILTIAKVKYWDDIELRFPLVYSDEINEYAGQNDLDPVILFGMIRRESVFNKDAHSPVGARGLMQIMPRTARKIAKDLNERWQGRNALYDPANNLKYGSYYYRKLLNRFNGHHALALAAYNAGPHRVKQWLPDESLPADIWIETIPFRETRDYVTTVLVYAMIYQQIMESTQLTMNDFTRQVMPLTKLALN